jgi:hypothetical protein
MSTFFDTKLTESMIPEHAVIHKQTLTQDHAAALFRDGVIPCSEQAYQVLMSLKAAGLGVNIIHAPNSIHEELSLNEQFLVMTPLQRPTKTGLPYKFILWTRVG